MSALGGILAGLGGGGAPEAGPEAGGGDPDALLAQIRDLMEQYVAMGPETPAYDVISQAIPALDEAMGAGAEGMPGEEGMMPPEGADPSGGAVMPEGEENSPMDMMPESAPSSFEDASAQALDQMKKRKAPR